MFTGAKIGKRNITTKRIEKNYLLCAKNSIKKVVDHLGLPFTYEHERSCLSC